VLLSAVTVACASEVPLTLVLWSVNADEKFTAFSDTLPSAVAVCEKPLDDTALGTTLASEVPSATTANENPLLTSACASGIPTTLIIRVYSP